MSELSSLRVTVAGAGVFGLAVALTLARDGAKVVVCDPEPEGENASAIAAGMIAPASEAALDGVSAAHFELLRAARDMWPVFASDLGRVGLSRDGAEILGSAEFADRTEARLRSIGALCERRGERLFTPEDWRIDPRAALGAMRDRLLRLGGVLQPRMVLEREGDVLVLATGYGGGRLAPELAALRPIKGQILRTDLALTGPTLRGEAAYVAPSADGALVGATMEMGRDDRAVDPRVSEQLLAAATALCPALKGAKAHASAGVRAATPDGLPMVGPSTTAGVWMASGARRNGWLLAPLVAEVISQRLKGGASSWTRDLDPRRFG